MNNLTSACMQIHWFDRLSSRKIGVQSKFDVYINKYGIQTNISYSNLFSIHLIKANSKYSLNCQKNSMILKQNSVMILWIMHFIYKMCRIPVLEIRSIRIIFHNVFTRFLVVSLFLLFIVQLREYLNAKISASSVFRSFENVVEGNKAVIINNSLDIRWSWADSIIYHLICINKRI